MPKVKKEYFEEKAQTIIDAALRVCQSKPAYAVTLKDVVRECGISQGGIYCYYSNIDEIFAEILNRCYSQNKIAEEAAKVFDSKEIPEKIIYESFAFLGQLMDDIIDQYGNLIYELNSLYLRDSVRGEKTQKLLKVNNDVELFQGKLLSFISVHIANGNFKPSMPKEHIFILVGTAIQGIIKTVTFVKNAELLQSKFGIEKEYTTSKGMMKILSQSIITILKAGDSEEETR